MNQIQTSQRPHLERAFHHPIPLDNTSDHAARGGSSTPLREFNCRSVQRNIGGQLLSVHGDVELPVEGAHVEIHSVAALKKVTNELPASVLAHCRTLLLEAAHPIALRQSSKHVADEPLLSFADVQNLRDIPGYELLATAARSQEDASFRRLLGSNLAIARLLLCYYHPASFSAMLMASVVTNAVGCFQCTLLEPGNADDKPGYLFIARHKISSNLYVTLYNPTPAGWYTHWDWPEDKTVILRTCHPSALRARMKQ